jgi:hypothetical protein
VEKTSPSIAKRQEILYTSLSLISTQAPVHVLHVKANLAKRLDAEGLEVC